MEKRNLLHIEVIRIIAAYFVIFNHTTSNGFFLFAQYERGSLLYWIYMTLSVFCKISVPLFFMIAGALLLRKDISLKKLWCEKIAKMVIVLFVFSLVMYIGALSYSSDFHLSVKDFLKKLYMEKASFAYWYLYAYIGLLISLPFLRAIVKEIKEIHYKYLIILYIIFTAVIPCVEYRLFQGSISINGDIKPTWLFTNIVFWPLLGYYLENIYDYNKCNNKVIVTWIFSGIVGIGISCYMIYYMHGVMGKCKETNAQTFHMMFIVFPCIAIYMGLKKLFLNYHTKKFLRKISVSVGGCTFGIYLIHVLVKENFSFLWDVFREKWYMNDMIVALFFCLIVFFVSYMIIRILKKVPVVKKLIY